MRKFRVFCSMLALLTFMACGDSDTEEILEASLTLSKTEANFGDVERGQVVFDTITVTGANISGSLSISVTGEGLTIDKNSFAVANLENEVIITFNPTAETALGALTGELVVTGGEVSETVTITANVLDSPFQGLASGTVVYENHFNFSDMSKLELVESDLEETATLHESVEVAYTMVRSTEALDNENRISVRTQFDNVRCSNGTAGDFEEDGLTPCGGALRIVGKEAEATSVTFDLTGLEADRNYTVVYYTRPNGTTERAMDVFVTGDPTEPNELYVDGDVTTYEMHSRTGKADAEGNLMLKFEYSADSSSRSIAIDDLSITVI